jgi:unsaturated chondroitin disaccharide hydrolase
MKKEFQGAMALLIERIEETQVEAEGRFPIFSDRMTGEWCYETGWTAPFWVATNWLAYAYTSEKRFRDFALDMFRKLDPYTARFQYYIAGVLGYELTGLDLLRQKSIEASRFLCSMFNVTLEQIPAFPGGDDVIIDILPSLAVLWWDYTENEAVESRDIALANWKRSAKDFIRPDGSTYQSIHYDLDLGAIKMRHCHHDARRDDACASQTHAWAINGYGYAYQAVKDDVFLNAGRRVIDYALGNLPSDLVPYHNFEVYEPYKDTSAATLIASSLLDWAKLDPDPVRSELYSSTAERMLESLVDNYLTPIGKRDPRPKGMLIEGCYNYLGEAPSNELIWGSYFLMEALFKRLTDRPCFLSRGLSLRNEV